MATKLFGTWRNEQFIVHPNKMMIEKLALSAGQKVYSADVPSPRTHKCPDCGAEIGSSCVKRDGTDTKVHHSKRVSLAESDAMDQMKADRERGI